MSENKLSFFRGLFNGLLITFLIFLLCFGCFMCGFNFHKQHTDLSYQSLSVKPKDSVDSDYSFTGSNFIVPISFLYNESLSSQLGIETTLSISLSVNRSHFDLSLFTNYRDLYLDPNYSFNVSSGYNSSTNSYVPYVYSLDNYIKGEYTLLQFWATKNYYRLDSNNNLVSSSANFAYFIEYYCSPDFNYNVVKCSVGNFDNFRSSSLYCSKVRYIDENDNYFDINVAYRNTPYISSYALSSRVYLLSNSLNDNQIYQTGYDYGYSQGKADEQPIIYQQGFDAGKELGSSLGYQHGVEDAGDYTFLGLLGAVVDAPVQTFIGLLNFEILGFNFLSFLTAILTIGFIVFIVRFVFFRR